MLIGPIEALLREQNKTYLNVSKPEIAGYDTPSYHYDWWLFPVSLGDLGASPSSRAIYYSIDSIKTTQLLQNKVFTSIYLDCIDKYLKAQETHWIRKTRNVSQP